MARTGRGTVCPSCGGTELRRRWRGGFSGWTMLWLGFIGLGMTPITVASWTPMQPVTPAVAAGLAGVVAGAAGALLHVGERAPRYYVHRCSRCLNEWPVAGPKRPRGSD